MKSKQSILVSIILVFHVGFCFSQTFDWGINMGGHTGDRIYEIKKASEGILTLSSEGILKHNEEGEEIWRFDYFKDVSFNVSVGIQSIAIDEKDNIYAILNSNKDISLNNIDFFEGQSLIKINKEGDVLWCRKLGGGKAKLFYVNKNIYVVGTFYEHININGEVPFESNQFWDCISWIYRYASDIYLAKFNDIGVLLETKKVGDDFEEYLVDVAIDDSENIYLTAIHGRRTCSTSYSFITKFDSEFNMLWTNTISIENEDSGILYPANLYYSENGKLYLWAQNLSIVNGSEISVPFESGDWVNSNLMEFNSTNGKYLRSRQFGFGTRNGVITVGGAWGLYTPSHGFMTDFYGKILVFTSSNRNYNFGNFDFATQEDHENLLLFTIDKDDFSSNYITHFEKGNEEIRFLSDMSSDILLKENKLYVTASFESNPIKILGNEVGNNSGNNDTDILIAKMDVSTLINEEDFLDDDNDGVLNYLDWCPNTVNGIEANSNGCSNIQLDDDLDGVLNDFDECPNTPPDSVVNQFGCVPFSLPQETFTIEVIDEICPNSDNGMIQINSNKVEYDYFISLNGNQYEDIFSSEYVVNNLKPGKYDLCVFVEEHPEFQRCFELVVNEATAINVTSKIDYTSGQIYFGLRGSDEYIIMHNERTFTTTNSNFSLKLNNGYNKIEVKTTKDCQGVYKNNIEITGSVYPNPFHENLNILLGKIKQDFTVYVYGATGSLLFSREVSNSDKNSVNLDLNHLAEGIYYLTVDFGDKTKSYKIIKK